MLTTEQLTSLMSILGEHSKPLKSLLPIYQKTFPTQAEQFLVGTGIFYLLVDGILKLGERLVGFYLLYDLYSGESLSSNPFLSIFLVTFQKEMDPPEKALLSAFIDASQKEVLILHNFFSNSLQILQQSVNEIRKSFNRTSEVTAELRDALSSLTQQFSDKQGCAALTHRRLECLPCGRTAPSPA